MAMYGNIRLLPGLEGGGFARVVQVEPIKSNVTSGGAAVALRLEKLANPLAGFKQDLSTYTSSENGKKSVPSTAVPQLSSEVLTMLQQVDGQPVKVKAQTQSAGSVYAAEAEQAEARRREYARQQEEQQQQHQEALAALEAQLKKTSEGLTPVPAPSAEAVTGDITQTNSALAAQAAQAYAATLIGTSSSEASVSA